MKSHHLSSICTTRPLQFHAKWTAITPHSGVAAPSDCGAPNGGTSAHSKHGVPKGRYVRSQHTKSAPNGSTSALNNLSTPIDGGSASSDCDISNSGGNLKAISMVVYPFPMILALPALSRGLYATGSPGSPEGGVSAPCGVATFNGGTSDHSKSTCANCQWCQ